MIRRRPSAGTTQPSDRPLDAGGAHFRDHLLGVLGAAAVPAGAAACMIAAALPWLRAYRVPGAPAVLFAAAILPVIISTVAARALRQGPLVSYLASLAGLMIVLLAASGLHPGDIRHALGVGPTRLLTETLPLTGSRSILAAPAVLLWVAATVAAESFARSNATTTALAVPLVTYLAAFAATSGAPGHDDATGPLLLVALGLTAIARRARANHLRMLVDVGPEEDPRPPASWRLALPGMGVATAVAIGTALVAGTVPGIGSRPAALSRPVSVATIDVIDPVAAVAALREDDPRAPAIHLLDVRTDSSSTGYVALAILDHYDGAAWTFDTTFAPTGGRVPAAPGSKSVVVDGAAPTVTQIYHVDRSLPLPLIPSVSRALFVEGLPVAADATTGMIVPSAPVPPHAAYRVTSRASAETLARLPSADAIEAVGGPTAAPLDTALPSGVAADISAALRSLSPLVRGSPAPTVAYLQSLTATLVTKEHRVNPITRAAGAPPILVGTSLAEVINAVTVQGVATPEQYATLFVMVARYLGVPARLATGFRAGASSTGPPGPTLRPGNYQVTNRQAWTWAEVPVAGLGWVVVDPTPAATDVAPATSAEQVQATPTTVAPHQATAVPANPLTGGNAIAHPVPIVAQGHRPLWPTVVLGAVAALLVALAAGPGLAATRRARRRRLRHRPDPAGLAAGAWLEVLDALDRAGMGRRPAATASEVATATRGLFGPTLEDPVREVGEIAERALYSVTDPPDASGAAAAWSLQRTVCRQLFAKLDRRRRARALLAVGHSPSRPTG